MSDVPAVTCTFLKIERDSFRAQVEAEHGIVVIVLSVSKAFVLQSLDGCISTWIENIDRMGGQMSVLLMHTRAAEDLTDVLLLLDQVSSSLAGDAEHSILSKLSEASEKLRDILTKMKETGVSS